jgi:phage regulator Rha-like protein
VTIEIDRRGRHRKYLPWVFTEHGAIMAAMLLRSERAVAMSVYVVRAFVQMREELMTGAVILHVMASPINPAAAAPVNRRLQLRCLRCLL